MTTHNTENQMEKIPEHYENWANLTPWKEGDRRPKVGSLWVVVVELEEGTCSQVGTVLRFITDDGSLCPQFSTIDDNQYDMFPYLTQMAPLPTEPAATELDHAEYVERDGKKYPWVEVRDGEGDEWLKRVLLADFGNVFLACANGDENYFAANKVFQITQWAQMRPIPRKKYRPYETLEECKHLIGETIESAETGEEGVERVIFEIDSAGALLKIETDERILPVQHFLDHYTHNGQPCGVEV
jgi:hypothetical protein